MEGEVGEKKEEGEWISFSLSVFGFFFTEYLPFCLTSPVTATYKEIAEFKENPASQ